MARKRIAGKVLLITGASSGIGKALADKAAAKGAKVVLAARSKGKLDTLAAEIREDGGKALAVRCDVTSEKDVKGLIDAAVKRFGRVDILVNNAGYGLMAPIEESSAEDVQKMFEVNVFGLIACTRAAVAQMREQGDGGHIVNVSSIVGHMTTPLMGAYSATKSAVNSVSDALRMEVADAGISVTTICPGPVPTGFQENLVNRTDVAMGAEPAWMAQSPDEIANIILKSISRKKRHVLTSFTLKMVWFLYAHFQRFVERVALQNRVKTR